MRTSLNVTEHAMLNKDSAVTITAATNGKSLEIGRGFKAQAFREKDFHGAMDPLIMVDHYTMTAPTFGAHPHAGLSAVSVLFEDSQGGLHNRDSLGNDFDLMPGDLYWLQAGAGAVHDESPRQDARIHGLQVFVNLPSAHKKHAPDSLHVKAEDIPVYEQPGSRIRIVLGESNGIRGQQAPALPMTILDGHIAPQSDAYHALKDGQNAWIYAMTGEVNLTIAGREVHLVKGQSVAISSCAKSTLNTVRLSNTGSESVHFALFAAMPIAETFVHKGPFVMSTEEEIAHVEADYAAGRLGHLD